MLRYARVCQPTEKESSHHTVGLLSVRHMHSWTALERAALRHMRDGDPSSVAPRGHRSPSPSPTGGCRASTRPTCRTGRLHIGTDFDNSRGSQTVTEGADAIVRLATLAKDGPTGTFQDRNGAVPW